MTFADRLATAVTAKGSSLVVGLDPVLERLPTGIRQRAGTASDDARECAAEAFRIYQRIVIDHVAEFAAAVKPQIAFYERWGAPGVAAYEDAVEVAHDAGLLVIGDVKRGDIGSTAAAYAEGHLGLADAVTVNAYLGSDGVKPFIDKARQTDGGLFVLVRTSNPSSTELQDLVADGRPLAEHVASLVHEWGAGLMGRCGYSSVGAVVGATRPEHIAVLREAMPHAWFLIPGVGAQGGRASDTAAAFDKDGLGAVVNSSRGILYAYDDPADPSWPDAVRAAAERLAGELRAAALATPSSRP